MLSVGSGNIILIDYFLFDAEFGLKFLLKPMPVVLSSYIKCKCSQNLLQPRDRPWLNFILLEEGKGFLSMVRLKIDLWGSPYSRIYFLTLFNYVTTQLTGKLRAISYKTPTLVRLYFHWVSNLSLN